MPLRCPVWSSLDCNFFGPSLNLKRMCTCKTHSRTAQNVFIWIISKHGMVKTEVRPRIEQPHMKIHLEVNFPTSTLKRHCICYNWTLTPVLIQYLSQFKSCCLLLQNENVTNVCFYSDIVKIALQCTFSISCSSMASAFLWHSTADRPLARLWYKTFIQIRNMPFLL